MEEEDEEMTPRSISETDSMLSVTVGRVMTTLLDARPRKLQDAISRLSFTPKRASLVSLDESLLFFHKYVRDASAKEEPLDGILVPMIEHSLKCKKSKHGSQSMILLNWLFEDELLFQHVATNLANIILKKEDRYITLGWCVLVRGLLELNIPTSQHAKHGLGEKYVAFLRVFCPCISHLLLIVCNGSILQDGYELPTRLSVAAADCILALTESLAMKQQFSDLSDKPRLPSSSASTQPVSLVSADSGQKKLKSTIEAAEDLNSIEMGSLLWDHLSELILLLQKLLAWSWKTWPLHANGLERVLKWLQEIQGSYGCFQDEAGSRDLEAGALLLSSCWKHYGMLLHLEDHRISQNHRELLDQYLYGIQHSRSKGSGAETIKFFLNCMSLLLGRLDSKHLESAISECGLQISQLLISQLRYSDEDVIDGVVCIFKAVIFKKDSDSSRGSLIDTERMNGVLPLLLNLLDEQDGTARAVVMLTAEYCSISRDGHCIQEILKRLSSVNASQRRNAIDVISACIHKSSHSENTFSLSVWQDIAKHLLQRLEDEEFAIRLQASKLLQVIDPALVLPTLVQLVYSANERVVPRASDALMALLKHRNKSYEVICILLDCLSNFGQSSVLPKTSENSGEGSRLDTDRVLMLIPEWSKSVNDWNALIGPLIDKMFAEPSNATIVRFLSYISQYLAEASDLVLQRILLHTAGQKEVDETIFSECKSDSSKLEQLLFIHLCPLLIVRLLPLRVFNDVNSSTMYGELLNEDTVSDYGSLDSGEWCVAALLLNRAFCKFEFEDVRKLAAELCGRIHPQVLFPIISYLLDHAASSRDVLKIKSCLFSICTSLVVRGGDSILHPSMHKIREVVESVLLWPSLDGDEISKAQHGCIDCLALMIGAELQVPESLKNSNMNQITLGTDGHAAVRYSVLTYAIHQLTCNHNEFIFISKLVSENSMCEASHFLPFRLCMANVLISACQKISDSEKKLLAQKTLPHLIHSVQVITDSEIRAACIQVLFSSVYHLKSAVLPYAPDLIKLSLKSLKKGSDKERMASAKLMAALMASEDTVVGSISGELLKARTVLSTISRTDSSIIVRQICGKLLTCITSP